MMRKKLLIVLATAVLTTVPAEPQTPPVAAGLRMPNRIAMTQNGNLLVAEGGTTLPNSGRISIIERTSNARKTLIEGLPSGLSQSAEGSSPSGPSGVAAAGPTVYVTIGAGDAVLPGPAPGSELANPTPSSPLLASLLAVRTSVSLDVTRGGFVLQPGDHPLLAGGAEVVLTNGEGETATVRLVADFPDYTAEPRPDVPLNVRAGNPFGVAIQGNTLFVVDASQNLVRKVDATTGVTMTLASLGKVANPLPFGPPMIDPVPDGIRVRGNDVLVSMLTGFPFPAGASEVKRIDIATGAVSTERAGFTSAIDVEPLGSAQGDALLVLEFSTSMTESLPGRIVLASADGSLTTIAQGLPTPSGFAVDRRSGSIYVSHIFPGLVTRIDAAASLPAPEPLAIVPVVSSQAGAFDSQFTTSMQISNPHPFPIAGRLVLRPRGEGGSIADPAVGYSLAPFSTRSFVDFLSSAGTSGAGSVDVLPSVGSAPIVVTTIANVAVEGNPSIAVPTVQPSSALTMGSRGVLVAPDAVGKRMNVGVRTLAHGATLTFTLRDDEGHVIATAEASLPSWSMQQFSDADLFGTPAGVDGSITVVVSAGSAIVYGVTIDNTTGDGTMQIARPVYD